MTSISGFRPGDNPDADDNPVLIAHLAETDRIDVADRRNLDIRNGLVGTQMRFANAEAHNADSKAV